MGAWHAFPPQTRRYPLNKGGRRISCRANLAPQGARVWHACLAPARLRGLRASSRSETARVAPSDPSRIFFVKRSGGAAGVAAMHRRAALAPRSEDVIRAVHL